MDVVPRLDLLGGRRADVLSALACCQCQFGSARAHRRGCGAAQRNAHVTSDAGDACPDKRKVAAAAGELDERAVADVRHETDLRNELFRSPRGREWSEKEFRRWDDPLAALGREHDLTVERQDDGRQLRRRVRVREVSSDGRAIADLRVPDLRQRLAQDRG